LGDPVEAIVGEDAPRFGVISVQSLGSAGEALVSADFGVSEEGVGDPEAAAPGGKADLVSPPEE